jgi:hypothetical protein
MNYFDKYLKYKNKYLEIKNKNNNIRQLNYQTGGTFVLYTTQLTRIDMKFLSLKQQKYIIGESLRLNRYFHKYYDINQTKLKIEGVCIVFGPGGKENPFLISNHVNPVVIDVDMYESFLIYEYLIRINDNLRIFDIETSQSQISYYIQDETDENDPNFFQNPFLEFSGSTKSIQILKEMMRHEFAKDLLFFSHYNTSSIEYPSITDKTYITFAKPVFNNEGNFIYTFDDIDFWTKMDYIALDMKCKYSHGGYKEFEGNDPDLDLSKDWYVLGDNAEVIKIEDKKKPNPYSLHELPLTILNVRYKPDIEEFTKVYSI